MKARHHENIAGLKSQLKEDINTTVTNEGGQMKQSDSL